MSMSTVFGCGCESCPVSLKAYARGGQQAAWDAAQMVSLVQGLVARGIPAPLISSKYFLGVKAPLCISHKGLLTWWDEA